MSPRDEVRILADNPTAADHLDRSDLVHAVSSLIATVQPPLTIAVYGEWGSGKSSFMDRVQACLDPVVQRRLPDDVRRNLPEEWRRDLPEKAQGSVTGAAPPEHGAGFVTVKFNLWEHQYDVNPVVAMLQAARQELSDRLKAKGWKEGWKDKVRGAWDDRVGDLTKGALMAMADAPQQIVQLVGGVNVAGLVPSGGTVVDKIQEAKQVRFAVQDEQTKLKRTFERVIKDSLRAHAAPEPPTHGRNHQPPWLSPEAPVDPRDRIIFFIDDLDRCPGLLAVDLLEKIRLFLNQEHCVFVLGADERVVKNVVNKHRAELVAGTARAESDPEAGGLYLEKMIQYAFYLPPVSSQGYESFVTHVMGQTGLRQPVKDAVGAANETPSARTRGDASVESAADPARPSPGPECPPLGHGLLVDVLEEVNATLRQTIRTVNALTVNDFLVKD